MDVVINEKTDEYLWIPVAKETDLKPARAFLPVKGLDHLYGWGYKARIEKNSYLDALIGIQRAFINNERQEFVVQKGNGKQGYESQARARWNDYSPSRALLSPSLGWVNISRIDLLHISAEELAHVLEGSGLEYARYEKVSDPIICRTHEEIETTVRQLNTKESRPKSRGQKAPKKTTRTITVFERDAGVVYDVLKVANGVCEGCSSTAPFLRTDGSAFLEVHHVKPLSELGSDTFENAVALCPNCHRELHYGNESVEKRESLYKSVSRLVTE